MPALAVKPSRGLLLSLCLWACAGAAVAAQEREQAERDLSEVTAAIPDIQAWLQQAATRESAQKSVLRKTQLALSEAQQALAEQSQAMAAARAEQQSLQQQSRELLASKREQEQVLAALLQHAYLNRKNNALKNLLNAENLPEGARQLLYTRYLSEFQLTRITTFNITLSELAALDAEALENPRYTGQAATGSSAARERACTCPGIAGCSAGESQKQYCQPRQRHDIPGNAAVRAAAVD